MKDDNVKISSLAFGLLIIFAVIGVSVVIGFGIDIVEPIFIRYGTYFLCGFFLLAAALQVFFALLGLGGGYFLREMPFIIPAFLAFMILFPLFIGTYPSINTDGGKYYYTFILTSVLLLLSNLIRRLKDRKG